MDRLFLGNCCYSVRKYRRQSAIRVGHLEVDLGMFYSIQLHFTENKQFPQCYFCRREFIAKVWVGGVE